MPYWVIRHITQTETQTDTDFLIGGTNAKM